jgi:hypothetical protein
MSKCAACTAMRGSRQLPFRRLFGVLCLPEAVPARSRARLQPVQVHPGMRNGLIEDVQQSSLLATRWTTTTASKLAWRFASGAAKRVAETGG